MDDYLKTILNAFHDLLFVFSADGIIEDYLTPNHEDELILPQEAFLGKHHRKALPPHVSKKIEQAFKKLDQGEEQVKFDYWIELKGEKHWYTAVISKIENGDAPRYLGAVRNITDRKHRELLFRGVLNTSPGGIMVFNTVRDVDDSIIDFEITHINKTVEKLAGASEEQVVGQKLTASVPEKVKDRLMEQFKGVVETETTAEFDYNFKNEAGETQWYLCKAAKFKDGLVVSFLEITGQKKAENELVTINEELKKLNRQKDKLFSVISHDLRNAVSGTMGVYDMIFEDYEELSKEDLLEYLKLLKERTANATQLLEDLLSWSKNQFQELTLNPEKLHLAEITTSMFNNIRSNAEDKGINLKNQVPDNIFVHADANMVSTILRNLVANGIKFSHSGGEIVVQAEKKPGEVKISVVDEGIGIEKDALEKIFDKKTNYTTPGTRDEKGSGLGLDLCIDFVKMHGGRIWAESEPGNGSTFSFTLPVNTT